MSVLVVGSSCTVAFLCSLCKMAHGQREPSTDVEDRGFFGGRFNRRIFVLMELEQESHCTDLGFGTWPRHV
jgi:hypothetical protein